MDKTEHIKYLKDQCIISVVYGAMAGFLITWSVLKWGQHSATYALFMGPWFIFLFIKDLRASIKKLSKILTLEDNIKKING